tara:strand:- start:12237 stop:12773 length:537 start_codon:yes stop_codon:yes gene_type:complete
MPRLKPIIEEVTSSSSSEEDNYKGSRDKNVILNSVRQQLAEKNKLLLEQLADKNKLLLEKKPVVNFEKDDGGVLNVSEIKQPIYTPPEIKPNLNMLLGKVAPASVGGGSASAAGGSSAKDKLYDDYTRNLLDTENLTPEDIVRQSGKNELIRIVRLIEKRRDNSLRSLIPFEIDRLFS